MLVSVRLPLSGYAVASTLNGSPILFGVYWLTGKLGKPGDASAVVAAAVGLMSLVAVLASRRPRLGTPVVLGLALLATGAASAGAVVLRRPEHRRGEEGLPARRSRPGSTGAHVGHVTLLQSFSGGRANSLQELFWNRSITRVVLLPGAAEVRQLPDRARPGRRRRLADRRTDGRSAGPLLVDTYGSTVRLRGTHALSGRGRPPRCGSGPSAPAAAPRLLRARPLLRRLAGRAAG